MENGKGQDGAHPGPSFILLLPITDRPGHVEASLPRKQDKAEEVQRRRSACGEEQECLLMAAPTSPPPLAPSSPPSSMFVFSSLHGL